MIDYYRFSSIPENKHIDSRLTRIHRVYEQEGLAVASIARDVVVEMAPLRDDNAR